MTKNIINSEILKAQAEYAAKPWAVHFQTRYFSATFRFDSENDAVGYIADQSRSDAKVDRDWRAELTGPRGTRTFDIVDVR